MRDRRTTEAGRLARLGFQDPDRAQRLCDSSRLEPLLGEDGDDDVLTDLGGAADPDAALLLLVRILEAADEREWARMTRSLAADPDLRRRLVEVIGMSEALGEFLARHPAEWQVLADAESLAVAPSARQMRLDLLTAVGAHPDAPNPVAHGTGEEVLDRLRIAYRRILLGIASRDLSGLAAMDAVALWLSDLADCVLEAALAIARADVGEAWERCRFAVIGMGKCGARELNYVSDVDVIYVAEAREGGDEAEALATATALAGALMRACGAVTPEGTIWEVDPNLRPEGKQGALVRTIASHVGYYERWASTWEFQALLKARPAAGDLALGADYVDAVSPFVWSAADHPTFVEDVQAMRRRVEQHIPARMADRELKLGPGGLRDVEFSVQLLQLVHGRSDVMLRSPTTMVALEALATWGYVGRDDAATLAEAYRFLRTLEHRIQLQRLRRTHTMPEGEADLRRLGRSMGFRSDPVADLVATWRKHAREVRRLHEKLFYRPLLRSVARLEAGEARLSVEAAEARLQALGYLDPQNALRHLQALTSGVSRRAAIQRTLLPVMLGWFADAPDPDGGLLGFRRVSDALGSTHWYLRLLRDESIAAERLARILATSRYATELVLQAPETVAILADDDELAPRQQEALLAEVLSIVDRHDEPVNAVAAIRGVRRRELFRTAAAELLGMASPDAAAEALTAVAEVSVEGALRVVREGADPEGLVQFSVIGMGRFGGHELGFSSDADVMFVFEANPGVEEEAASRTATHIAEELRALLMAPTADPPLDIDADLRPEGKQGPLVRSLESYRAYYGRWSSVWEAQALLRADVVAGDAGLGQRFLETIDYLRWIDPLTDDDVVEVRRLKARMESERLPRGADPALHTKLGRGGLSDVEWVVQLLQMRHSAEVPGLRTTRTLRALEEARAANLIVDRDADALAAAWRLATAMRNAVMLVRGRASDQVPTDVRERRAVAFTLGYELGETGRMIDDYQRTTRRARQVFERLFYGVEDDDADA
ncbi:MAG: bifunctional [glutamine synthetase] adenylyltransferase/[glutamine synthetase]-adenylyl-L-tyrosine phosphorylase [Actinomycetales bacterium]|nr:bifunctional [glutamine synthetase] adenylyltransferase/[glutamine synthetase]-adenylyl-L-tyrosine phosphorylase [Actinomycetales bacterium]